MNPRTLFLAFLVLAASCNGADESLVNARRAQALLGSEVWSQILRIENTARGSAYPRALHALVFQLAGILWFYSDTDGTQSFSLHRGRLAEEKADFGPLLRDIEPGFIRWKVVEADLALTGSVALEAPLRNGCFIESYAALRVRVARGASISEPRLLLFYGGSRGKNGRGHTVLTYSTPGQVVVVDPLRPKQELVFAESSAADPVRLARTLEGLAIVQARVISLELPAGGRANAALAANKTGALEVPR